MKKIAIAGFAAGLAVTLSGCQTTGIGGANTAASYMGAANAASGAYMGGGGAPAGSTMAASQVDDGKKSCEQLRAEIEETQAIEQAASSDASSAAMTSPCRMWRRLSSAISGVWAPCRPRTPPGSSPGSKRPRPSSAPATQAFVARC